MGENYNDEYATLIAQYPFIYAWHRNTSYPYYIADLMRVAVEESAPWDAVYRDGNGTWVVIGDCCESTIARVVRSLPKLSR